MPHAPDTIPPMAAPKASITDQVADPKALAAPSSFDETTSGKIAFRVGKKKPPIPSWRGGQDVKQPNIVRTPNQKEAECDDDTRQVSYDEGIFAVIAVGNHASDGTDEEWGEHTDDEKAADSESGLGQYCDERSGCDKIEPIP